MPFSGNGYSDFLISGIPKVGKRFGRDRASTTLSTLSTCTTSSTTTTATTANTAAMSDSVSGGGGAGVNALVAKLTRGAPWKRHGRNGSGGVLGDDSNRPRSSSTSSPFASSFPHLKRSESNYDDGAQTAQRHGDDENRNGPKSSKRFSFDPTLLLRQKLSGGGGGHSGVGLNQTNLERIDDDNNNVIDIHNHNGPESYPSSISQKLEPSPRSHIPSDPFITGSRTTTAPTTTTTTTSTSSFLKFSSGMWTGTAARDDHDSSFLSLSGHSSSPHRRSSILQRLDSGNSSPSPKPNKLKSKAKASRKERPKSMPMVVVPMLGPSAMQ